MGSRKRFEGGDDRPGVAIVHYSAPPVVGGVETILRNQAVFLAECGMRVRVIVGVGGEIATGVETVLLPELSSNYPAFRNLSGHEFRRATERLSGKIRELLAGIQALIVHNMLTMPFNLVATAALRALMEEGSLRSVVWCHDSPYFDPAYRVPHEEYPYTLMTEPVPGARYVTITEHRREQFSRLLGLPEEEIEVVRNGVDLSHFLSLAPQAAALIDEFSLYERDLNVISPVRITPRKNLEMTVRICQALRYYYPDLLLIITGYVDPHNQEAGDYFKRLKGLVEELGMGEHVLFLGEYRMADGTPTVADWKATRDIYSLADVLMLTSYAEGFGLPVLEAGLLRMPIVCSNIPTLREVLGSTSNAIVVDLEEDPRAVAGRIHEFLSSHATFQHFKHVFREYHWKAIGKSKLLPLLGLGEQETPC
ncbi:glycosyltransferase family 4 protein [Candidatus Solincola tengchongensis]|uniref:glycosyltransferase family 4 protein n=1 Tax=Candidatus Solincola tengchongensis TaxID=2900693 RepID=UPI00257D8A42|nr:glycosyltransferase family 4 protein [Candidatus Solincola tengchongensis]